ncbi:hypothetical protein [Crateriforma spongiae]|uniref:hypothetical protein n=1 Tax=Crateriforma spongiae TaxID=2724528 RepID=UPI00144768BE|nr:hypothetical protein [Crateriforma spongiae]
MTWAANQIYARPFPAVAEALSCEPFLANQMFLIDNLEGIRFQWVRDRFLSDDLPESERTIRHDLPEGGLLAISPHLVASGYSRKDPPPIEFAELFFENRPSSTSTPIAKWDQVETHVDVDILLPDDLDVSQYPIQLLRFLKSVSVKTASPIVYYYSFMWGGSVEIEIGWAFDETDHVYQLVDEGKVIDYTYGDKRIETDRSALQMLMAHVDVQLPTSFFALHEGSFDWKRYWLRGYD